MEKSTVLVVGMGRIGNIVIAVLIEPTNFVLFGVPYSVPISKLLVLCCCENPPSRLFYITFQQFNHQVPHSLEC